ncbi:MAG: hypothetical protein GY861_21645 [bacterium]|nr:hypothetical protein [bacterium]
MSFDVLLSDYINYPIVVIIGRNGSGKSHFIADHILCDESVQVYPDLSIVDVNGFFHYKRSIRLNLDNKKVLKRILGNCKQGLGFKWLKYILYSSQGLVNSSQFVVDHPETFLHPTSQLELGEFFASLFVDRKIFSVIETHSANILLRLRHLIRMGYLKCTDVILLYVREYDDVLPITIDRGGSLCRGLPMSFFGGDVMEALEFNAGL